MPDVVWIGLAEVEQRPGAGVLLDRNSAYLNVLALAHDEITFQEAVTAFFNAAGFELVALEDSEPLWQRARQFTVDPELLGLAEEVALGLGPRWGTFHTWTAEE